MSAHDVLANLQASRRQNRKELALLIDPDALKIKHLERVLNLAADCQVDYLFVGGSLLLDNALERVLTQARQLLNCPLVLFPGSPQQISTQADALLLLSLISGRNADLLIGRHVEAAMNLRRSGLQILPTGYMLIDGGKPTSVSYMSQTQPLPRDKDDLALCTALAGELLGLQLIYLDAGSGALQPVSESMIARLRSEIQCPLIVGGGIRKPEQAASRFAAGADVLVVGNALEKDPELLRELANTRFAY